MQRWIPEVRALYERVRRPARMMVMGLVLMAPAGGFLLTDQTERSAAAAVAPGSGRMLATAGVSSGAMEVSALGAVGKPVAANATVGDAWRAKALERERDAVAERFARQFRIPVALAEEIHAAAVAEGIEPRIAFGLVRTESSFRRNAVSSAGAVGLTQVLPSTAQWLAPGTKRSDLFDTRTNLRIGFRYLDYLLNKYNGNIRLALTAYNRGPGTVDRLLRQGRNPENGYADKVLRG